MGGVAATFLIGAAVGAGLSRQPAGVDIAAGGSPLYGIAVAESVKGLGNKKDHSAPAQGAVCPNCGEVHAPAAASPVSLAGAADGADGAHPAPAEGGVCPQCGNIHSAAVPQPADLPAPANGDSKGYYYCADCKTYHRRQVAPSPPDSQTNAVGGLLLPELGL